MSNPSAAPRWCCRGQSAFGRATQYILLFFSLRFYDAFCYILSHPLPLILLAAFMRRARPVAILFGSLVCVTKAGSVREVLRRLADFSQAEELGPKIPWGPFMVVIDWPQRHKRERELLQSVVSPGDVNQIRDAAAKICRNQIKRARTARRINFVQELCEPAVVDVIQSYFGIPNGGKNPDQMARILGHIAGFIMVEPPIGSKPRTEALDSMATITKLIEDGIAAAAAAKPADHLLGRLVSRLGNPALLDRDWIRRYITGLAVFGGGTIVRATTQAINQLLRYPVHLGAARNIARSLEADTVEFKRLQAAGLSTAAVLPRIEAARANLQQIIYEALRFQPMLPILSRYIPRETVIAKDTSYARSVPAGATVLAPPIAAMFDPEEFPHPWHFRRDRCLKKYVHFGFGPRLCFGEYIADTLMIEIFRAVLLCDGLKRAAGASGRIKYEGPAARSLVLTFN